VPGLRRPLEEAERPSVVARKTTGGKAEGEARAATKRSE